MNPYDLTIVKDEAQIDEQRLAEVAEKLTAEYEAHKPQYDGFQASREDAEITGASVRRAILWTVGSIKTDTRAVDDGADGMLKNLGTVRDFLQDTHDGALKWDKFGPLFTSDIPDRVAELLRDGRVNDAHALLAGRDPETGKPVGKHYLRVNKASLVLYLLDVDRMCVDTRIWRALKPAFGAVFTNELVSEPDTADPIMAEHRGLTPNPYRDTLNSPKPVPVMSHSGDTERDFGKTFWEDRLRMNPIEYTCLTDHVIDRLARHADVPRELIPQVAFNTEGETTFHDGLMERL